MSDAWLGLSNYLANLWHSPRNFLITYEPHVPGSTPAREPDSGH